MRQSGGGRHNNACGHGYLRGRENDNHVVEFTRRPLRTVNLGPKFLPNRTCYLTISSLGQTSSCSALQQQGKSLQRKRLMVLNILGAWRALVGFDGIRFLLRRISSLSDDIMIVGGIVLAILAESVMFKWFRGQRKTRKISQIARSEGACGRPFDDVLGIEGDDINGYRRSYVVSKRLIRSVLKRRQDAGGPDILFYPLKRLPVSRQKS